MKANWCQEINKAIENFVWRKIFRVHFRFSCDASLTRFQHRLLYRIIGVRKYLATIDKDDSGVCRLCTHDKETLVHLFFLCNHLKQLWGSISIWKIGVLINFKIQDIILGYLQKDFNYDLINLLVMCTKKYIFKCAIIFFKTLLELKNTNDKLRKSHYLMMHKFEKENNVTLCFTSSYFTKIN